MFLWLLFRHVFVHFKKPFYYYLNVLRMCLIELIFVKSVF